MGNSTRAAVASIKGRSTGKTVPETGPGQARITGTIAYLRLRLSPGKGWPGKAPGAAGRRIKGGGYMSIDRRC